MVPRSANKPAPSHRQRARKAVDSGSAGTPKGTQRERLVEAMIELCTQSGYQGVSIAQISSRAGVSSATFYEQFDGKEDCLIAAYRAAAVRVFGQMTAVNDSNWSDAARATLGGLLKGLQSDPNAGRVIFIEALAGGPRLREEQRRVRAEVGQRTGRFLDATPTSDTLDIPTVALIGAVRSIVARHLRTNAEDQLPSLLEDLLAWIGSYTTATGKARWSTGPQALLELAAAEEPSPASRAPAKLPRGRHGLPAGVVARSQRTRIIHATAEVMMAKGYASATVADIVAAAGVARDVFYEHFTSKQHAFLEAQRHPTQYILDACAASYFAAEAWPERVWNFLYTLTRLISESPAIAHLRLVECYAAGPVAIRRAEEITRSFTIFFEQGYGYRPQARELPRLCSQAVTGAIYEVIQRHVARHEAAELPQHLPQLVYVAIAPFTGAEEAIGLVEQISAKHLSIRR